MKYSVLTLFLATGYIALVLTAFQQIDSWWRHVGTVAWLLLVVYFLVLAFDPVRRSRALFGRVTLACLTAYLAVSLLPNMPTDFLPHQWLATYWNPNGPSIYTAMPVPTVSPWSPYGGYAGGVPASGTGINVSTVTTWSSGQLVVTSPSVVDPMGIITMISAMNTALFVGLLGGLLALWKHRSGTQDVAPRVATSPLDADGKVP